MTRAGRWAPGLDNWESSRLGGLLQTIRCVVEVQPDYGGRGGQRRTESGAMNIHQSFKCLITEKNEVPIQQMPSMTRTGDANGDEAWAQPSRSGMCRGVG